MGPLVNNARFDFCFRTAVATGNVLLLWNRVLVVTTLFFSKKFHCSLPSIRIHFTPHHKCTLNNFFLRSCIGY